MALVLGRMAGDDCAAAFCFTERRGVGEGMLNASLTIDKQGSNEFRISREIIEKIGAHVGHRPELLQCFLSESGGDEFCRRFSMRYVSVSLNEMSVSVFGFAIFYRDEAADDNENDKAQSDSAGLFRYTPKRLAG